VSPDAARESAESCGEALVAILRGLEPGRAIEIGAATYAAGFRAIEVPLNSPDPFTSIERLVRHLPRDCQVGAGTVLSVEDVARSHAAGGRLIVAPNCDPAVIRAATQLQLRMLPGVATATEAFAALTAGATQLKLFPAVTYGPRHLQALRAVIPMHIAMLPVGGVAIESLGEWIAAGASGFGFGSELFRPDYSVEEISQRAHRIVAAFRAARGGREIGRVPK
jgi:2-dehydro-3-deoxyphosphogalactonate aldolase